MKGMSAVSTMFEQDLTVGALRKLDSCLYTLLWIYLADCSEADAPASRKRSTTGDELLVAQPDLYLVLLTGFQAMEDRALVDSAETEEGITLLRVDAEFDDEFAVNKEVSTTGDVEADFPFTIFIGNERGGVLLRE